MKKVMNEADISVIIPIYNVEEYLEECLDSVVNQTKSNIEIVVVDDGSTDSSGEIAKAYAEKYDNLFYYLKENGGLGRARNFGIEKAHGEYITFMDSDDVISLDLYEKMFYAVRKNDSDVALCNVARFNSKRTWIANLHQKVFSNIELNTHITKNPNLIYDTISCNKLIRRSFWDENNFSFPEDILYEDIPVIIPLHFKANNVSVIESSYYFWRLRDGATKSITQHADSMRNINDRIKVLRMVDKFFADNDFGEEFNILKQKKALEIDLMIFVNNCVNTPIELSEKMFECINEYIDEAIDPSIFSQLPLILQQKYAYVRNYDVKKLIELVEYENKDYYNSSIYEKNGRFFAKLPSELFTIESRDATNELIRFAPKRNVTEVLVKNNGLEISAYLYKSRINISDITEQEIKAYLENEFTGELTPVEVISFEDPKITQVNGSVFDSYTMAESQYNYDATAFKLILDLNEIEINSLNEGYNRILICYKNRLSSGRLRLSSKYKLTPNSACVSGEKHIKIEYDPVNELRIYLKNENNFADNFSCDGDSVSVTLEKDASGLWAQDDEGNKFPFEKKGGSTFSCKTDVFSKDKTYYLYLSDDKGKAEPLLYRDKKIFIENKSRPAVVFMTNKNHESRFIVKSAVTSVESITKSSDIVKIKTSAVSDNADFLKSKTARLYVNDEISGEKVVFAVAKCNVSDGRVRCTFSVDFSDRRITRNLYASMRDLLICYESENGFNEKHDIFSTKFYKLSVEFETLQINVYRAVNGNIRIKCSQLWRQEENTANKRKALIAQYYPKYREEKIDPKLIIFESMWGSKYSCNPQHLYEYIDANYPEYKCVWALNDARTPIKGNAIRVRRNSLEYYHYLATAKYLVNNVNYPNEYVKREGQIEIQTMHGTPLKTLGLDVKSDFRNETTRKQYIEKNSRWNYLIVQGKFMKGKAYDCYAFEKEILETGYPRTDILFNADSEKILNIKKTLGLPLDKKIILYTPTWRTQGGFDMQLDIEKMKRRLGDEYILLVRIHHLCAPHDAIEADNEFVFDLHSYNSVEDLYLISDILITDYSSVMFDYALLDKPMLFFTYDLEDYRDNLRGLYVDIEKEAPGPLVFDTDELIDAVINIDDVLKENSTKIAAFKEKYLTYENGESCEKIVQRVMHPDKATNYYAKLKRKIKKYINKIK